MKKIRTWSISILVVVMIFCAAPAYSQVSFIAGTIFGGLLFGGEDGAGASATVIYTLSDISNRVKNPLDMRMATVDGSFSTEYRESLGHLTMVELFRKAVKDSQKYEILQIVRVFRGDAPRVAAIWFAYIEKEKVRSSAQK